jgi:hypothetical protein
MLVTGVPAWGAHNSQVFSDAQMGIQNGRDYLCGIIGAA